MRDLYRVYTGEMWHILILGHYTDIHSIFAGRVGGRRAVQSIDDDNGHYSDIRSITTGGDSGGARATVEDHYQHYIDIDHLIADSGGGDQPTTNPGSADQAVRSRGYEGLDPTVLAILRQPPRPHDYTGLGTQQTAEQIEMTTDPGSADQAVRPRGYEGLDPTVLATLRQPPRPHDYTGLGTQQTAEQIEMNEFEAGNDRQNTVSRQL